MNKVKILYVEDEPFLGKIVKESLESREFEVKMLLDGFQWGAPLVLVYNFSNCSILRSTIYPNICSDNSFDKMHKFNNEILR